MPPKREPNPKSTPAPLPTVNLRLTSSKPPAIPPAPSPAPTSSAVTSGASKPVKPGTVNPLIQPNVTPPQQPMHTSLVVPTSPPLTSMLDITPSPVPSDANSLLDLSTSLPVRSKRRPASKKIPNRRPKKRETFIDLQEILKKRADKFPETLEYLDLSRRNSNHYVALKQRIQPSSRRNSPPTYEARFSKPNKRPIQAEIFISSERGAPAGKVPPKVDENLKKCLTEVLEVFKTAKVPVVNIGGALVVTDTTDSKLHTQTYEILKNAIGPQEDKCLRPIPVLNKCSILNSLLFCFHYETVSGLFPRNQTPIHRHYAKLILKNKDLREELESNLQPYKNGSEPIPDEELRFVEFLLRQLEPRLLSPEGGSRLFRPATQNSSSKTAAPKQSNNSDISAGSQNISSGGKPGLESSNKRSLVNIFQSFFKKESTSKDAASCGNEARQKGQTSNASGATFRSPQATTKK